MPFGRQIPALLLVAVFVVLATAQRLLLTWLLWKEVHPSARDVLETLARGCRIDAACAAVVMLVLIPACSLLPERAWRSKPVRFAGGAAFALGLLGIVSLVTVDTLQFMVHHARLAPPFRERLLVAWRLLAGDDARAQVAAVAGLGCLVAAIALAVALRGAARAAWREKIPLILRVRDLILGAAACVLALALMPADVPFPGRPVLGEIAGSSIPAVARRAWSSVSERLR